jgi:hypothetical protein
LLFPLFGPLAHGGFHLFTRIFRSNYSTYLPSLPPPLTPRVIKGRETPNIHVKILPAPHGARKRFQVTDNYLWTTKNRVFKPVFAGRTEPNIGTLRSPGARRRHPATARQENTIPPNEPSNPHKTMETPPAKSANEPDNTPGNGRTGAIDTAFLNRVNFHTSRSLY